MSAAHGEAVNAATAAHVERLRGLGSAGHHDRLAEVLAEALATSKAADGGQDFAKSLDAWALIRAAYELAPVSLRIGVSSSHEWRSRSRGIRQIVSAARVALPRPGSSERLAADVFAHIELVNVDEEPTLHETLGARVLADGTLQIAAGLTGRDRALAFAFGVAVYAIECADRGPWWKAALETAAALALAVELVDGRNGGRSRARGVLASPAQHVGA